MIKICPKCELGKEYSDFTKNKNTKDGLSSWCRICTRSSNKESYYKNHDSRLEHYREYHHANKDKINQYKKEYYVKNKENILELHKEYRVINKDKLSIYYKTYYEDNKDLIREKQKKYYYKTIPAQKERSRKWASKNLAKRAEKSARRRALKLQQTPPNADQNKIDAIYEERTQLNKEAGYIKYHVDHIIPLSKGGLHHEENLRVITATENLSKGDKLID